MRTAEARGVRRCAADHNTLLNRKAGYTGTQWHAHPHHEDGMGPTTEVPALGQVRSLVYPEGFGAGKDGGLRVRRHEIAAIWVACFSR